VTSTSTTWLLLIVVVAIYIASRWMRGRSSTEIEQSVEREQVRLLVRSVNAPAVEGFDEATIPAGFNQVAPAAAPVRAPSPAAAELAAPATGLIVSRYYFRDTDLETGPADLADFYDELFVELLDPASGQIWKNSMHVATLRGLERMMIAENWDTVIGGELLIIRSYDLLKIMSGATGHLEEIYETTVNILGVGLKAAGKLV